MISMKATPEGATLSLMGDFGFDIRPQDVQAALKEAGGKPLTISINSYGGDALAGIAIHNMLARYEGKKTVIVEGIAASAASLAAMAGDRIVMPENAFLMIHEAWGFAMGDAADMRGQADVLELVSSAYRRTYAQRSGLDEAAVAALMAEETWFTAQAAVDQGFATEIAAPAQIHASAVKLTAFAKVPAALLALASPTPTAPTPPAPPASQEATVPDENVNPAGNPPVNTPTPPLAATIDEIQALADRGKLGAEFVVAQLRGKVTLEGARDAAIEALAERSPAPVPPSGRIKVDRDEGDTFRAHASTALAARMMGQDIAHSAEGHDFRGMSLLALGRELMLRAGERNVHRLAPADIAERILAQTHTTSDFPNVLVNSTNKVLTTLYAAMNNNWSSWCDEYEVDDFKTITTSNVGQFPEPLVMPESGPVTFGTVAEEAETFNVKERGRLLRLSRPALINDDLRAFTKITQDAAVGAYTALRRTIFGVLAANANMADGNALFSTAHANLGTAGGLSTATYSELWQLLAQMTTPTRTGLDPAAPPLPPPNSLVLVVAPNKVRTAYELTSSLIVPTAAGNALPTQWRGQVSVEFDGFLNTGNGPYYLARTEPGMRAMEVAYLRGRRVPQISSAEAIDYTGVTFRVLFDFEAKASTWRTIAGNLG